MAHLHAVILGDFFDENLLHSVILSIQFVHNLQNNVQDNMIVSINSTHVLLLRSLLRNSKKKKKSKIPEKHFHRIPFQVYIFLQIH